MRDLSGVFTRFPEPCVSVSPSMAHAIRDGEPLVSFTGRVDGRADLAAELGMSRGSTDPALIVAAYLRWGDDFLAHVIGDFAVALWDARTERLLLGRDSIGAVPLFYHRAPGAISWSTSLAWLLDTTGCDRTPDRHYVAGFLMRGGGRTDVSPYAALAAVPPATVVTFTRDAQSSHRYWRLEPESEIRLASDAEYEEQFFSIFRSAVSDRLAGTEPIFAELSGGVDSTSIVAVADRLMDDRSRPRESLQTISRIYDAELMMSHDEPFLPIAEAAFHRPAHHIAEREHPFLSLLGRDYPFEGPSASWGAAAISARTRAIMAAAGSSVLLSGVGGDHLCYSEVEIPMTVADHLAAFRIRSAMSAAAAWSAVVAVPQLKILRIAARQAWVARFGTAAGPPLIAPWLDRGFLRAAGGGRQSPDRAYRIPSRREQSALLRDLAVSIADRRLVAGDVEVRYPYADRRLAEFAYAIPLEQHFRPAETRSLQRRAMARLLPPAIARRATKGGPTVAIYRQFRRRWPEIRTWLADPRVCAFGCVDRAALTTGLQRAAHGFNVDAPGLMRVLALESWFRSLEQSPAAAGAAPRQSIAIASERR